MKRHEQLLLIVALGIWSGAAVVLAEGEQELLESEGGARSLPEGLDLETIAEFRQLDRDGSGSLSLNEFQESEFVTRTRSFLTLDQIEVVFSQIDSDGGSEVSLTEFANSQHNRNIRLIRQEATRTYVEIDSDLDGLVQSQEFSEIDPIELRNNFRIEGREDARSVFQRIDLNQNRILGPFEYSQALSDHRCHSMRSGGSTAQSFADLDANDDGCIDRREYADLPESKDSRGGEPMAFEKIDSDGNRELSPREFFRAKSFRWHRDEHMDKIMVEAFEDLDNNRNGVLSLREFSRGFYARNIAKSRDEVDENFAERDVDEDGDLTLEEFSEGRWTPWKSKQKR